MGRFRLGFFAVTALSVTSTWACALVSGVDNLQKVECVDACDAGTDVLAASDATSDANAATPDGSTPGTDAPATTEGDSSPVGPTDGSPPADGGSDASSAASAYRTAVLTDSPAAYWRLGDAPGSTTSADETGNGNTGLVSSTSDVTFGVTGALKGDPDTAAKFDGLGVIAVASGFDFSGNSPFTWEIWVKPQVLMNNIYCPFLASMLYDTQGNPTHGTYMVSYSSGGDTFGFERYTDGTANAVIALDSSGLDVGQWTYVVATMGSDGTGTVYMNGTPVISAVSSGTVSPYNAGLTIGYLFKGSIDEVAIYDHALTQQRITAHYNAAQ